MTWSLLTSGSANGTVASCSVTINSTGADFVAVVASWAAVGGGTVTDNKGNTVQSCTLRFSPDTQQYVQIWYLPPGSTFGASHTFTLISSFGNSYPAIVALAFTGSHASPYLSENGAGSNSATTIQPGSVTPSEGNCLVITALSGGVSATTPSVNGGFTAVGINGVSGTSIPGYAGYLIQTSATAANPTWSSNAAASRLASAIAVFKAAPGASPPTVTDFNTTETFASNGTSLAGTGTNLTSATFKLVQGAVEVTQTKNSGDATNFNLSIVGFGTGGSLAYGVPTTLKSTTGAGDGSIAVTPLSPGGLDYVTLTSINSVAANRITAVSPDLAITDQLHITSIVGTGTVNLNDDATFDWSVGVTGFYVRRKIAGGVWEAPVLQTTTVANIGAFVHYLRNMGVQ